MASYGNGDLKIKTLGDLRRLVNKFNDLEDDYEINLQANNLFLPEEYILTDDIDVSYSDKHLCIGVEVKYE